MKKKLIMIVLLSSVHLSMYSLSRVEYQFSKELIDVVIPCHKKDRVTLEQVIEGIKAHVLYRRIIVVSSERLTANAEWYDERSYPFNKYDLAFEIFQDKRQALDYIVHPRTQIGWIYQQFLKLYAPLVIPDISPNVLIVDADTIFLNNIVFQDPSGAPLFNYDGDRFHHEPYFDCMNRLIPGLKKVFQEYSGICHHMLFQKVVLEDLFAAVQNMHGMPFWKAVCHVIDRELVYTACFSEYETYFNFIFSRTRQAKLRLLKWENLPLEELTGSEREYYDQISCHSYLKKYRRLFKYICSLKS